jgi:hypothetical protein
MFVRVVRFTDVDAGRLDSMLDRIKQSGPPPGVRTTGLQVLVDEAQGTVVVLQQFATAEDMDAAAQVFGSMDAAETPGTRASVDESEQKVDLKP